MKEEIINVEDYNDSLSEIADMKLTADNYMKVLSKKPNPRHVKKNPYANNADYLSIGYIEAQLDRLFLSWNWTIKSVQNIANGIVVVGDLTVKMINGNVITRSGIGGVEIQTKKGATSLNVDNIASKAMERDPGRAEAHALKNAAAKLGNAFGRGLNREFNHEHQPSEDLMDNVFGKQSI